MQEVDSHALRSKRINDMPVLKEVNITWGEPRGTGKGMCKNQPITLDY